MTDYNPVCPYCGMTTVYKPEEWVEGGPLMCANPMCETNHPPERRENEPFDRLTRLCKVMTDALEDALEVEAEEHRGSDVKLLPVRAALFLDTDESGGIQLHNWDDDTEAMAALFMHLRAIFRANGRDLEFVPIPDSPEGL